jgi:hypothetical protein
MLAILKAYVNIAFRKLGPEDLPDSRFLLGATLAFYLVVQIPLIRIVFRSTDTLFLTRFVDVALLLVCLWVLLRLTGLGSRYRQTLTALLGTSGLLSMLSIPFNLWSSAVADLTPRPAIPSAFILVIVLWSFVVDGHILSRALSKPFVIGLIVAVTYFFVHTTVLFELVPVPE